VKRLLVMLPWLMERGEVSLAEMSQRFGLSEAELVKDLELAAMCGLPPYEDELVDLFIDDDVVVPGVPRLFTRPLRLTAPEGFALLASSSAAMSMPGADPAGPLSRALQKLANLLGPGAVVVDVASPPWAADVSAAAAEGARLVLSYWSAAADEPSEREVTPLQVFVDRGNWYLIALDHRSGEQRTFRIDRIEHCVRTGVVDPPVSVDVPAGDSWFEHSDLPSVTLHLSPAAAWVVERYPTRSVEPVDDGWVVELTVAHERWLAELLLRLGTSAKVLRPGEWTDLARETARTVLARYEAEGSTGS
jgi:proteasome accessory factor C